MTTTTDTEFEDRGESDHWVSHAERYDRELSPFGRLLVDRADIHASDTVLDVGCGCGATTLDAARLGKHAVGVDVSAPMLHVARRRAAAAGLDNVEFVHADAADHRFDDRFDVVISRFGMMFFADPPAAFANIRRALRPGGRLAFVCWRSVDANPWLLVPGVAAAAHVPLPNLGEPGAPGMFALADPDRIRMLLDATGFDQIVVAPIAPLITVAGGGSLDETVEFLLGTGIASALFDGATTAAKALAVDAVREAFGEHYRPGVGVVLGTGAWLVHAVVPT